MKRDLLTSFVELEKEELQQLCTVVNETIATGVVMPAKEAKRKAFGINDLWSHRRNMRTAGNWSSRFRSFIVRG